jgi:hypothetical protein
LLPPPQAVARIIMARAAMNRRFFIHFPPESAVGAGCDGTTWAERQPPAGAVRRARVRPMKDWPRVANRR